MQKKKKFNRCSPSSCWCSVNNVCWETWFVQLFILSSLPSLEIHNSPAMFAFYFVTTLFLSVHVFMTCFFCYASFFSYWRWKNSQSILWTETNEINGYSNLKNLIINMRKRDRLNLIRLLVAISGHFSSDDLTEELSFSSWYIFTFHFCRW